VETVLRVDTISSTGPSSDHTTGLSYYMYVEASTPNNPNVGPFDLETSLGSNGIGSVFFWYNMYGQSMGTLALQIYSNVSGWGEHWSKSGDQGEDWQMGAVDIDSMEALKLKFVFFTGSSYTSDVAIDDINITRPTTFAPSITPSPSNTPSPTCMPSKTSAPSQDPTYLPTTATSAPSQEPTYAPTTVMAFTISQFQNALEENGKTISVSSDILLSVPLMMSNVTAVRIIVNNFEVSGGGGAGCFYIVDSEVWISDLVVTNCSSLGYGRGLTIYGYSQVSLLGCIFSHNEVNTDVGGAIYFEGIESANYYTPPGKSSISKITLRNCTLTQNSGGYGGAISFNYMVSDYIDTFTVYVLP